MRDQFAPGQLFDLTDDERLAAPSFEEMDAGVAFGDDTYTFAASAVVRSPFDYTDITIGADGNADGRARAGADRRRDWCMVLAGLGAAARAVVPRRRRPASSPPPPPEPR